MSTAKRLPWYRRYVSDWRAGTRGMSLELKGFYSEILDAQWDLQGQLPFDEKMIAMACDCNPRSVRKLLPQLIGLGKIIKTATGYYNPRMMKDILGVETLPVGGEFDGVCDPIRNEFEPNSNPIRSEFASKVPKSSMFSTREVLPLPEPLPTVVASATDVVAASETASPRPKLELVTAEMTHRQQVGAACRRAAGQAMKMNSLADHDLSAIMGCIERGADLDRDVLPTIHRLAENRSPGSVTTWKYFSAAIEQAKQDRLTPPVSKAPPKFVKPGEKPFELNWLDKKNLNIQPVHEDVSGGVWQ
jgi:Protein of unknown function (DUF1376)